MGVALFALRRLAGALLTLVVVTLLVFVMMQAVPGGYEDIVLGPFATEAQRAEVAERYGLDEPVPMQYVRWVGGVVQGDLGTSLSSKTPVTEELGRRLMPTLQVVTLALLMAVLVGVPLGIAGGLSGSNPVIGGASRFAGALTISLPDFVVGATLVYLFSVHEWWFRVGSYVAFSDDAIGNVRSIALPSFTLGLFGVAIIMRTQRDAVRSVLTEPYVVAAVARGARPLTIIRRHILRNSAIPVMTVIAVLAGAFISGTVIVENLFSIPGIGVFFLNAVRARDYAVVQAAVLLSALTFVASSMLADIGYAILDPRVGSGASARSSG